MANSITITTLVDGPRNVVLKVAGIVDTADVPYTLLVDPAALSDIGPFAGVKATSLRIDKMNYDIQNEASSQFRIYWDTNGTLAGAVLAWSLVGRGEVDGKRYGGFPNPKPAGWSGKIYYATSGDFIGNPLTFDFTLEMVKCSN